MKKLRLSLVALLIIVLGFMSCIDKKKEVSNSFEGIEYAEDLIERGNYFTSINILKKNR